MHRSLKTLLSLTFVLSLSLRAMAADNAYKRSETNRFVKYEIFNKGALTSIVKKYKEEDIYAGHNYIETGYYMPIQDPKDTFIKLEVSFRTNFSLTENSETQFEEKKIFDYVYR